MNSTLSKLVALAVTMLLLSGQANAQIRAQGQATLKLDVVAPARTAGTLLTLGVKEGDVVTTGQVLGKVDDTIAMREYEAAQHEARVVGIQKNNDIELRLSQKSRAVSERELEQSRRANERYSDAVSSTELARLKLLVDQAILSEEKAQQDIEIAAANFELKLSLSAAAKEKVDLHKIISPINGTIASIESNAGEWVNLGQPVIRIVHLDVLRVEANIDGSLYGTELLGQPATFTSMRRGKKQQHAGKVVFVSPELNAVDGSIRIWCDIKSPHHHLKPGMRGDLIIEERIAKTHAANSASQ